MQVNIKDAGTQRDHNSIANPPSPEKTKKQKTKAKTIKHEQEAQNNTQFALCFYGQ